MHLLPSFLHQLQTIFHCKSLADHLLGHHLTEILFLLSPQTHLLSNQLKECYVYYHKIIIIIIEKSYLKWDPLFQPPEMRTLCIKDNWDMLTYVSTLIELKWGHPSNQDTLISPKVSRTQRLHCTECTREKGMQDVQKTSTMSIMDSL